MKICISDSMLYGKKVLVTGAGGFIGSHLIERLVKEGCKVRAFVKYNKGKCGNIDLLQNDVKEKIEIIFGNVIDSDAVRRAAKNIEIIFHLAALVSIPYSYSHPREVIETNVLGTLNVLIAGKENKVEKIIHTSTSEVYGTAQYVPIDENHILQAQSPYSASKIAADKIAESFYRSYNLPVAIIRPFNQYGPRQSARAVIPTIITQALTSDAIRLGTLTPTRDFTYVLDTVDAFIKIAESPNSIGEVINIGSGFEISIGDLAKKIISIIGRDVKIVSEELRVRPEKSEVIRLLADIKKAKKLLGWEPKISLDEGLKKTIEWISKSLNLYKPGKYEI